MISARVFGACSVALFEFPAILRPSRRNLMRIEWKSPEDRARVWNGYRRACEQRRTTQRDRYNVVLLLGDGGPEGQELQRDEIAAAVGRSRQFVDEWARRYRKGGFDAIVPGKAKGKAPKLTPEQDEWLKGRLDAGATEEDGVCSLRGEDICRIIREQFGVTHTLGGIYDVLARIGYCPLAPRPSHRKKDPEKVREFLESAPLLRGM
jgi:transposase